MSGRLPSAEDADARAVRVAAQRTTRQVTLAATSVVLVVFLLAVAFVLQQSRPSELLEAPRPGETKIYVDAGEALVALVVLGVLAVAVLAVASRRISRRAVAPLGEALRMQRAFVADASHELRTPLTVLDTRVQVLQRKLDRAEPIDDTLVALRRDTRQMIELVTDLLLVAETADVPDDPMLGSDLRPVVLAAVHDLQVLAAERSVAVDARVGNEARVRLSEVSLRRCVVVLVDNAVAHCERDGRVVVTVQADRDRAVIEVADTGGGIRGVDPGRLFDRFSHGAETGRRRGFGLGLSLVRDLAERHGGTVEVAATSEHGTTMRLVLPVVR